MLEAPELQRSGELVAALPPARAAALLGLMADDRATDIVHELDEEERARLIPLLGSDARQVIQKLLSYPPNTMRRADDHRIRGGARQLDRGADPAAHPPGRAHA